MADRDDGNLDDLFAEARGLRPEPSAGLMARILADAEAVAGERRAPAPRPPAPARGWLASLPGLLGGWPAMGGLAASAVIGVGIGVAQPAGLAGLAASIWGDGVSVAIGLDEDPLSLLEG